MQQHLWECLTSMGLRASTPTTLSRYCTACRQDAVHVSWLTLAHS
jgi:hypothetical protein